MEAARGRPVIRRGYSLERDAALAVAELHAAIVQPAMGIVVFFCSSAYDLGALAAAMRERFAGAHVIGCTTAGEISPIGYLDGSITGFSIAAADCLVASHLITGLSGFQIARGHAAAETVIAALGARGGAMSEADTFALLLIDGMSTNEEAVLSSVHRRLGGVALLGGSAGDDLRLRRTHVYFDGAFHPDAALLTLVKLRHRFRVFRCQHFTGSDRKMVVTEADPARRIVSEINAEPAAREYARIVGLDVDALAPMMFAEYPVMVKVGGDYYVRSIQKVNEDGSLTFFCAIDEGVVLTLARPEDILDNLRDFFGRIRAELGPPELVIGFDCILRSLEFQNRQIKHLASRVLAANNVIGFSTYGEQFAAMHVNQTFTAAVIGGAGAEEQDAAAR